MKRILIIIILLLAMIINGEIVKELIKDNNTYTKNNLIFGEIGFSIEDTINNENIDNAITNLKKTGLFGEVKFYVFKADSGFFEEIDYNILDKNNTNDTIIVKFVAKETLVLLPAIGTSIDSEKGVAVTLGVYYGNLWGIRHIVSLTATFGYYNEFAFEYSIPSLYSRKYNSRMKFALKSSSRNDIGIKEYHKNILFGAGYSTIPYLSPEFFLGYDRMSFDNDSFSLDFVNNAGYGYDEFLISGISVKYDKRDDNYYPQNGIYAITSFTHNHGLNFEFNRWLSSFDIRLYKKIFYGVFAFRNYLQLQDGDLAYYNLIEPATLENRCIANSDIISYNRYTGSLEYRFKIPYLEYNKELPILGSFNIGVMLVAFSDWSYINDSIGNFDISQTSNYHWGYGGGIRLYSNIFNVAGFDLGYEPNSGNYKYNILIFSWNF